MANCDNTISELTFASGYGSGSSFNLIAPDGQNVASVQSSIGLDVNSNLWVLTSGFLSGGISELTAASNYRSGVFISPPDTGLNTPTAMALDSAGNLFATNLTASLSEVTAESDYTDGAIFAPGGANLCAPAALAIDAAGNVFVANACTSFAGSAPAVSELLGLAAPVMTPEQACLKLGHNLCLP